MATPEQIAAIQAANLQAIKTAQQAASVDPTLSLAQKQAIMQNTVNRQALQADPARPTFRDVTNPVISPEGKARIAEIQARNQQILASGGTLPTKSLDLATSLDQAPRPAVPQTVGANQPVVNRVSELIRAKQEALEASGAMRINEPMTKQKLAILMQMPEFAGWDPKRIHQFVSNQRQAARARVQLQKMQAKVALRDSLGKKPNPGLLNNIQRTTLLAAEGRQPVTPAATTALANAANPATAIQAATVSPMAAQARQVAAEGRENRTQQTPALGVEPNAIPARHVEAPRSPVAQAAPTVQHREHVEGPRETPALGVAPSVAAPTMSDSERFAHGLRQKLG